MIPVRKTKIEEAAENLMPESLWKACTKLGYPVAVWRLPNASQIKFLISTQNNIKQRAPDLENVVPGFVIGKFHWEEKVGYIEGDIIVDFTENGGVIHIVNNLGENHPFFIRLIEESVIATTDQSNPTNVDGHFRLKHDGQQTKECFVQTVGSAVDSIRRKAMTKVVLSRTKAFEISNHFQPFSAFQKLVEAYPTAFVSLVNIPEEGAVWLGATPELLVSQNSAGIFKTMSLAGTQRSRNNEGVLIPKSEIRWGEKEIEEQALVSRYIVECFKKIRLREYKETGPKTILAGNLYHLKTDFEVNCKSVNFPELYSVMLLLLHPTSAVCGTPKDVTLGFIAENESFDRDYYSGFLGPVQVDSESNLFVNLRTVRIKDNVATFFAGAGITEDSNPEKEWEETEMKCDTLIQVIAK